MTKHENNADISAKCCTLIWLMAKESISSFSHFPKKRFFKKIFIF